MDSKQNPSKPGGSPGLTDGSKFGIKHLLPQIKSGLWHRTQKARSKLSNIGPRNTLFFLHLPFRACPSESLHFGVFILHPISEPADRAVSPSRNLEYFFSRSLLLLLAMQPVKTPTSSLPGIHSLVLLAGPFNHDYRCSPQASLVPWLGQNPESVFCDCFT